MPTRPITGNPSEIIVEQLVASGVKYVFYNSGSREALFFDSLHAESFVRRYQRHGPVVVISDLYDRRGFRHALDVLRCRGYEPRVVQIHDPREAEPEFLGDVELFDVEAETARQVTVTERAVRRYRELFARFRRSVRDYCARYAIDCLQIASDAPENEVLSKVLGCSSS